MLFCGCKKQNVIVADTDETEVLLSVINTIRLSGCMCGADSMPPTKKLKPNTILTTTAINYAYDLKSKNFFSHISLDGTSPIQRAALNGYTGAQVGEILGYNYSSINAVVHAWKSSAEHCRAMMDSLYTEMGAGKSGSYWVVNFGRE